MITLPDDATGNALREFISNGSDLTKPMVIDFFVAIPSEDAGNKFAAQAETLGFLVSVEQDEETLDWTCYCTKTIIPDYETVFDIEQTLSNLAIPFGGHSDGFGSYGNA